MSGRTRPVNILANKLVARGVRLTRQRRLILDLIESSGGHLDAAQIQELAREKDSKVDRATVYRTLALLKAQGLIEELDFLHVRGEQHFYEARGRGEHVHACCTECGKVAEFSTELLKQIKSEIEAKTGFHSNNIRVEVGGLCSSCQHGNVSNSE